MSLVAYPDSDDDDDEGAHDAPLPAASPTQPAAGLNASKRKRVEPGSSTDLPPLPASFHDLYSTNARVGTSDDPTLHGGRKRAVPHVQGRWPSHVYLEWVPSHTESEDLHRLIESIKETIERANSSRQKPLLVPDIHPSLRSELGAPLPLHISLSRTLQLKTEQRDAFFETLTSCLRKAAVKPFSISFTSLKWVPNFERNRWFLVLGIAKPPHNELNKLLEACNTATEKFGHPGLYSGGWGDGPMERDTSNNQATKRQRSSTQPSQSESAYGLRAVDSTDNFHVSIAWNLDEPAPEWISLAGTIDVKKTMKSMAPFDVVKAKTGNVVHNVQLNSRASASGRSANLLGLR